MKGNEMRLKKVKPVKTYKFVFHNTITNEYSYGNKVPSEYIYGDGKKCQYFIKSSVHHMFWKLQDKNNNILISYVENKLSAAQITFCLVQYFKTNIEHCLKTRRSYKNIIKKDPERDNPLTAYYRNNNEEQLKKLREQLKVWGKKAEEIKKSPDYLLELLRS
jgi:hypothetical protein